MTNSLLPDICACDVEDKEALAAFRSCRKRWYEWLVGDDEHSISKQITTIVWDDAIFRTLNEARRQSAEHPSPEKGFNADLLDLLDRSFVASQVMALRRLTDPGFHDPRKGVISLARLLADIEVNSHLLTREHYSQQRRFACLLASALILALGFGGAASMKRAELIEYIARSRIFRDWHWFRYHFSHPLNDTRHPLADSVIQACLACDDRIPGYGVTVVDRLAAVAGREKHLPDWEHLLQLLAELHVVTHVLCWKWPEGTSFETEPTAANSQKNPELLIKTPTVSIGIEVKAPSLFQHQQARTANSEQIASRFASKEFLAAMLHRRDEVTWPRDNPVKDFLFSADQKFASFGADDPNFVGILVICWDDFVYEPISAVSHPRCGLFTPDSFARDRADNPILFPSVAGVVVIRHLHQLFRACRDEPLVDGCRHPLDYGDPDRFPWKAFIDNPHGRHVPDEVLRCLQARTPSVEMGAEYQPAEYVMWIPLP